MVPDGISIQILKSANDHIYMQCYPLQNQKERGNFQLILKQRVTLENVRYPPITPLKWGRPVWARDTHLSAMTTINTHRWPSIDLSGLRQHTPAQNTYHLPAREPTSERPLALHSEFCPLVRLTANRGRPTSIMREIACCHGTIGVVVKREWTNNEKKLTTSVQPPVLHPREVRRV